ncbi:MAG: tRNA pseudouridine(13) synthase TruD [Candidatus Omnitrophica bacterium]|nr:tRNA pseudouridine(13) synthase TruD [Candidatus Omnitrophota bacterium]
MIPFKIKVQPKDFIVKEIVDLKLNESSDYGLYILEKQGYGTVELLKILSKKLNLSFTDFSYGGRKDKCAYTIQYITIKNKNAFNIKEKNYSLKFCGYTQKPMQPAFISANEFKITVRDLSLDLEKKILNNIDNVKNFGYPNYFDNQRFGSYHRYDGFFGEKILRRHYSGALKIYLTNFRSNDTTADKARKEFFFKNWGDWKTCLEKAKTDYEKKVFSFLKKNKDAFIFILQRIPKEKMSLYFAAYQSYLWNILVKRLIKNLIKGNLKLYKGLVEDYLFYEKLDSHSLFLKELIIPLAAKKAKMPPQVFDLYIKILNEQKLKPTFFDNRKLRQAFFKPIPRKVIVIPKEFSYEFLDDEFYKGKRKLILKFILPRGSYGTMLVKRLFS